MGELLEWTRQTDALRSMVVGLQSEIEKLQKKVAETGVNGRESAKQQKDALKLVEAAAKRASAEFEAIKKAASGVPTQSLQQIIDKATGVEHAARKSAIALQLMRESALQRIERERSIKTGFGELTIGEKADAAKQLRSSELASQLASVQLEREKLAILEEEKRIQQQIVGLAPQRISAKQDIFGGDVVARQKAIKDIESSMVSIAALQSSGIALQQRRNALLEVEKVTQKQILAEMQGLAAQTLHRPQGIFGGDKAAREQAISDTRRMIAAEEELIRLQAMGMGAHGPFTWERQRIMAAQLGKENVAAGRPGVLMGLGDEQTTKNIEKQADAVKKLKKEAGQFAGEPLGVASLATKKLGNEMQRTRILTFQLTSGLQDIAVVLQGGGGIGAAARAASNNLGLLFSTMSTGWAIAGTAFVIGAASLLDYIGKKWPDAAKTSRDAFRQLREEWDRATDVAKGLTDAQRDLLRATESARESQYGPARTEQRRMEADARAFTAKAILPPGPAEDALVKELHKYLSEQAGGSLTITKEIDAYNKRRKELEREVSEAEKNAKILNILDSPMLFGRSAENLWSGDVTQQPNAQVLATGIGKPPSATLGAAAASAVVPYYKRYRARKELEEFNKNDAKKQKDLRDRREQAIIEEQRNAQKLLEAARKGDLTELPPALQERLQKQILQGTRMRLGAQASMAMMGLGQVIGTGIGGYSPASSFDRRQLELQREIFEMERPYKTSGRGMPFRVRREIEGKRAELEDLGLREREAREREKENRQGRVEDLTLKSKLALEEILTALTVNGILIKPKTDKPDDQPEPGWHKRQQEGARNPVVMNPAGR